MKRRGFLRFLGMAAASPVVAPLVAKAVRRVPEINEESSKYAGHTALSMPSSTVCFVQHDYVRMSNAGEMPRYEGVVYGGEGNAIWRFDNVSGLHFKCHNCETVLTFNREDFRQHGQTCNQPMEAY